MNILEKNDLRIDEFKQNLLEKKIPEDQVESYITAINEFHDHLKNSNESILAFQSGKLVEYTDKLVESDPNATRFLIIGLWSYFPFVKKNKLPSKHFDCALLIFVLEHLDYGEIAEYFNWFKKQKVKRIIIITENPFNPLIWLWFWNNPSHKRPYPKISIQKIARDFGYSVDVHKFWGLACFQYVELVL